MSGIRNARVHRIKLKTTGTSTSRTERSAGNQLRCPFASSACQVNQVKHHPKIEASQKSVRRQTLPGDDEGLTRIQARTSSPVRSRRPRTRPVYAPGRRRGGGAGKRSPARCRCAMTRPPSANLSGHCSVRLASLSTVLPRLGHARQLWEERPERISVSACIKSTIADHTHSPLGRRTLGPDSLQQSACGTAIVCSQYPAR